MGNTTSDAAGVAAALPTGATPPPRGGGTKLFRWAPAGRGGAWDLAAPDARVRLYDANEDREGAPTEWRVEVEGADDAPDAPLDDGFEFEPRERRVTFAAGEGVWALQFAAAGGFDAFCARYNKALFENRFGLEGTEANELKIFGEDFRPALSAGETDASRAEWAMDVDGEGAPDPRELAARGTPSRVAAERAEGAEIQSVVVGGGERSFLVRGAGVDVLRNVVGGVADAGVSFQLTPPPGGFAGSAPGGGGRSGRRGGAATPEAPRAGTPGAGTPGRALLMDRETRMNVLTPGAASLLHADLETGAVVAEFAFRKDGADVPMRDMATDAKGAQLSAASTFLSLDANRLARWDLRDPRRPAQEALAGPAALEYVSGKDYARGARFSCMATSGDGHVVVGSEDGKIRLYSEKTLAQAKTAIPGLGAPVTAVDVSYDGRWALATTKSYLMVVKTAYKDPASGRELSGFTSRMGAAAPAPRLLRLRPADAARAGGAPLEKGRFTWVTEAGRPERWVVASCGRFTVLWSFRSVKTAAPDVLSAGGLTTVTQYQMIPRKENVVDSVFMHDKFARTPTGGGEAAMVVVTGRRVYTAADRSDDEEEEEEEEEEGPGARGGAPARLRQSLF